MRSLFIYGAGGFGREIMDVARRSQAAQPKWTDVYFIDDFCTDDTRYGARVFGFDAACTWMQGEPGEVVIATGEPAARLRQRPPHLILGLPDAFIAAADYRFMLEREGLAGAKIAATVTQFLAEG